MDFYLAVVSEEATLVNPEVAIASCEFHVPDGFG
jgi:hypothetical protein